MSDQSSNRPLAGKAVTYKALDGPEVIEIVERTVRAPAAGEVRIEVKAAAVNPTDILLRDPGFGGQTSLMVPGMDAAGIIESVGPGVSRLHAGEKVMAAVMLRAGLRAIHAANQPFLVPGEDPASWRKRVRVKSHDEPVLLVEERPNPQLISKKSHVGSSLPPGKHALRAVYAIGALRLTVLNFVASNTRIPSRLSSCRSSLQQ
jgi:hypothetical protein